MTVCNMSTKRARARGWFGRREDVRVRENANQHDERLGARAD